jgi:hypothetical protein
MLLEDYMDRVSGRLLSETSTSEMTIDGRRKINSEVYVYLVSCAVDKKTDHPSIPLGYYLYL